MAFPSIYKEVGASELIQRIEQLSPMSQKRWGKMNVAQMLAHCAVPYEQAFGENTQAAPLIMKWMVRLFFKNQLINEVPYKPNSPTAPAFVIVDQRDFNNEKSRLISYINKVVESGESFFNEREHITLGKLSATEWNNLLYKHLDHHLKQFGA